MKKFLFIVLILLLSCSGNSKLESNKVYSFEEIKNTGIKIQGQFETDFPQSIESSWAYYKGRELGFIMYPSTDLANKNGKIAAEEQTELIEVVEKNIAYGEKVEKTACRGHGDSGGWTGRHGIKLGEDISSNLGIDNTLIINKLKIFNDDKVEYLDAPSCPRREPLYTEYIIYGNIVFLIEPLRTSGEDPKKFIENLVSKLP